MLTYIAKPKEIINVHYDESTIVAYNGRWETLWVRDIKSQIAQAIVVDVDQNGTTEVLLGTTDVGKDPGCVVILDQKG